MQGAKTASKSANKSGNKNESNNKVASVNKSSDKRKSVVIESEQDFEDQILNISLKKPTRAYNFYLKEMKETRKKFANDNITNISHECSKKWANLSEEQKLKYQKMQEEDEKVYKEHLALVKKYILEKPLRESATAYTIFLDEKVKKAIEEDADPKEAKKAARAEWKSMSDADKAVYEEKREKHKELYEALRRNKGRVSGYTLYIKDVLMQAKEKNEKITLIDCAEKWKKLKSSAKQKYQDYADEVREERERLRDMYEITFGIKPKRPIGAYKFFMMELAKEGKLDGKNPFVEAAKLWTQLSPEKKERYQKVAKKRQLAYIIKKEEYNSSVRKSTGKAPTGFNLFVSDMKDKVTEEIPENSNLFEYCYKKWQTVDAETKNKYNKRAEEEKVKFENRRKDMDEKHDMPKRPITPYNRYVSERFNSVREKVGQDVNQVFKAIADEWQELNPKVKEKYIKEYQGEQEKYKQLMEEWEETKTTTLKSSTPSTNKKRPQKSIKKTDTEEDEIEDRRKKGKKETTSNATSAKKHK